MTKNYSPPKPPKRKIFDYFGKAKEPEDKKQKLNPPTEEQSTSVNVQSLKCPKKKVLIGEESEGIVAESSAPKKRTSGVRMRRDLGRSQRVLDCGQQKIGNHTCKECGMVYCVDDVEDVKTHEKFHSVHRFEIPSTYDSTFLKFHSRTLGQHQVYYLHSTAPTSFKTMISNHITKINKELGYTSEAKLWEDTKRVFLVTLLHDNKKYIGGVCVAEKIHTAWTDTTQKEVADNEVITKNEVFKDWIVGIDRIWVNARCRKKGVAYSLLDAATTQDRQMNHRVRRLRVAFSDPTDDGKALAKRFIETRYSSEERFDNEILVY